MSETLIDRRRLAGGSGGSGHERRPPRMRLLNVTAESPGLDFTLLELSPIGMSIETRRRLAVGEVLRLTLHHKDGTTRLEGEVRWSRLHLTSQTAEDGSRPRYRAGLSLSGDGLMAQAPAVARTMSRRRPSAASAAAGEPSPAHAVYRWSVAASTETGASRSRDRGVPTSGGSAADGAAEERIEAIREMLEKRTLQVVFQPIYSLKGGNVFAYEALARSPIAGLTSLPELYEIAALAGLVGELGRQHRTQAVEEAPDLPLFINVNPHEFDYGWLVQPDDPIFKHGYQVFVEVTENVPVSRFQQCLNVLEELRGKGVLVAIDDLGSGFSNLRYLNELAPDFVKIDRSLIAGVRDATRQYRLLESIVAMCKNLGSKVIAEGVEHADVLVAIDHAGVDYCQGYLLGRPELPPPAGSWPAFR